MTCCNESTRSIQRFCETFLATIKFVCAPFGSTVFRWRPKQAGISRADKNQQFGRVRHSTEWSVLSRQGPTPDRITVPLSGKTNPRDKECHPVELVYSRAQAPGSVWHSAERRSVSPSFGKPYPSILAPSPIWCQHRAAPKAGTKSATPQTKLSCMF